MASGDGNDLLSPAPPVTSRRLAEITGEQADVEFGFGSGVVILPMGSQETHGPALPMGDFLLAEAIALRIAERHGKAFVAPVIPYGGADFFRLVPGAVSVSTRALAAFLEEVLRGLLSARADTILIVNGHGGSIPAIDEAQRALRQDPGATIPALHLWRNAGAWQEELGGDSAALGHGGDPIASVALHLFPGLCHPRRFAPRQPPGTMFGQPVAGFGALRVGGAEFNLPMNIDKIAPGGVQATDPRGSDAARGAAIVERLVAAGTAMLQAMRNPE